MEAVAIIPRVYTYQDYLTFPDEPRCELIDGVVYMMATPTEAHQRTLGNLNFTFGGFLRGRRCQVYLAPFDVRIPLFGEKADDAFNVVQPDVMVYCNPKGVDKKGGVTAPELVIEVLSPATATTDKVRKFQLYEKAGMWEYRIVDTTKERVEVFRRKNEKFVRHGVYNKGDTLTCSLWDDFEMSVADVFYNEWEEQSD